MWTAHCDTILLVNRYMKRLASLSLSLLLCFLAAAQPSFRSKAEAMTFSKNAHNGAILSVQKYASSHNANDLISAVINSGQASSVAQDCVAQVSDIFSFGSDAVKIVKANNYIMAYFFHEVKHRIIGNEANRINFENIMVQYGQNLLWMAKMLVWDKEEISWLYGSITEQDLAAILAFVQYMDDDPDAASNEKAAGGKSIMRMIDRDYFDLNCFKTNGIWNTF